MAASYGNQRTTHRNKHETKTTKKDLEDKAMDPLWKRRYEQDVPASIRQKHTIKYHHGVRLSSQYEGWVVYNKGETFLLMEARHDKDFVVLIRKDGSRVQYANVAKGKNYARRQSDKIEKKEQSPDSKAKSIRQKKFIKKKKLEERL